MSTSSSINAVNKKSKLSGAANRKRKLIQENEQAKLRKCMDSFLQKNEDNVVIEENSTVNLELAVTEVSNDIEKIVPDADLSAMVTETFKETVPKNNVPATTIVSKVCDSFEGESLDLTDIGNWPNFRSIKITDYLISKGPIQVFLSNNNYPKDEEGRHFSKAHYQKVMPNGESFCRRWLIYSPIKNAVFCFCCKIFRPPSDSKLCNEGINKWKHLSDRIKTHEESTAHKRSYQQWVEAEIRLNKGITVDNVQQKLIQKEYERWQNVLMRLMNITLYLGCNNIAFRGSSDKFYTANNGKFLGLVQMIAKFDPVMENHVALAMNHDISDHYCGKNIQNELIALISEKVISVIVSKASIAHYYSIIADCTPDCSHQEQLSFTIRFVDISCSKVEVKEHFLGFFTVDDSTGLGLAETLINVLNKYNLPINNCRGQGYDNGANMKGKNKGVQKRILDINPLAMYVPCGCHCWNLLLCDAANCSVKSISLFGILQKLFTLFSASNKRWQILKDHVKALTLKKLSETRWEAKISAVKAVRYQISEIHDALITLAETEKTDPALSYEASTLAEQLKDFSFIVSLVSWYDILFQVNLVSKIMQNKDMDIAQCAEICKKCYKWLQNYRENGFKQAIITATDLANELDIEPVFKPSKRIRRIRQQFDELAQHEPLNSPEKQLEIEFFNPLLDTALNSFNERFEQFHEYEETWGFLFNIYILPDKNELLKFCADLQIKLTDGKLGHEPDINGLELCDELINLRVLLESPENQNEKKIYPTNVLQFIKKHSLQNLFPNTWIAYRILLTIPVTVASGERSFSKLKLIKTYLRSTMGQDRLSNLGTLSIENEIAENLDLSSLVKDFAEKKARRVNFGYKK